MSLFDDIINRKDYQKLLEQLPEDERKAYMETIKKMVDSFENNILLPIKNLKSK
jgi:hypothetical protein